MHRIEKRMLLVLHLWLPICFGQVIKTNLMGVSVAVYFILCTRCIYRNYLMALSWSVLELEITTSCWGIYIAHLVYLIQSLKEANLTER